MRLTVRLSTPFLLLLAAAAATAAPRLELAAPFTDHMVLQRERPVPVWGFDVPGSEVTVGFAGQSHTAVADDRGRWRADLAPLEASAEERNFRVVNDRGDSLALRGVLVGEVWFASGQSNMVWTAGKSMCRDLAREIAGAAADIPIREINIDTVSALYPQARATSAGGWRKAADASNFSALSLSFANELYRELQVPVGIVLSAHSNTRIEAFTARQAIESHPDLGADADLIHDADPLTGQGRAAYTRYYDDLRDWQQRAGEVAEAGGKVPPRPNLPGIAGLWRGPSQFFNGKINPVIPYAIRGAIWCQGTSNSSDGRIYAARMEALVRGWRDAWDMPDLPFYFTQMQCYGAADPDTVGFADLRQAQHRFFIDNRDNVGMVVQSDLNSAHPGGIHYFNKLHPGMRLARWALAHQYGRDIAYTGPVYAGYRTEEDRIVVSFESDSLSGGLMVGEKGMAEDYREPQKYVEPARPAPGTPLNHFRLCGENHVWHAAEATIVGDTVVVRSNQVPNPVGVQYAYSAVPVNSNLYNRAGLPATPFAAIDGELIFEEDDPEKVAAEKARYARWTDPDHPILQVAEYYRDGAVIQRDLPIPVWGHANAGEKVTVTLAGVTQSATANDLQQWSLTFPAMAASSDPVTLSVESSHGFSRTVSDILVGDVWYLTGSTLLTSDWPYDPRDPQAERPAPMPLVREFCRRTKASTFPTPRKQRFETGSGKYRSHWLAADYATEGSGVTAFAYHFAKSLDREGVPQGFITMSSGAGGRSRQLASPLSWTSFHGVKDVRNPAFQARLDELFLQFPHTGIAKDAAAKHIAEVMAFVKIITETGRPTPDLPLRAPAFPEAGNGDGVATDTIPTYTYNWCVSPLTPISVAGVIWLPSEHNIGENPADYAAELEIYARSLPRTYGQASVQFLYAQPAKTLVGGITQPDIPDAKHITFDQWPGSLEPLAAALAGLAN